MEYLSISTCVWPRMLMWDYFRVSFTAAPLAKWIMKRSASQAQPSSWKPGQWYEYHEQKIWAENTLFKGSSLQHCAKIQVQGRNQGRLSAESHLTSWINVMRPDICSVSTLVNCLTQPVGEVNSNFPMNLNVRKNSTGFFNEILYKRCCRWWRSFLKQDL